MASDGGNEPGEGELVGPSLLDSEYPGVLVHPLCGDGAVGVGDLVLSYVGSRLVAGE